MVCMFQGKLGQSYSDVVVVLQFNGLHAMKCHVCEHHQILTHTIDAIHCITMTDKRMNEITTSLHDTEIRT